MHGLDWDAVRAELKPQAAAATSPAVLRGVIRDMLGRLGLSHFALIPSGGETGPAEMSGMAADTSGDPGLDVRLIGRDLIVTSVDTAAAALVRPGWRLTQIGSRRVVDLLRTLPEGASGADRHQQVEAWRIAQMHLRGPAGSKVDLILENGAGEAVSIA